MKVSGNKSPNSPKSATPPTSTTPPGPSTPAQQTTSTSPPSTNDAYIGSSGGNRASRVVATGASNTRQMSNAEVRAWYNQKVAVIPENDAKLKAQGVPAEERARIAAGIRHDARLEARRMMSNPVEVEQLRARDMEVYGNPDGPTFEQLVAKAKSKGLSGDAVYEYIIGSSNRTNAEVNAQFSNPPPKL